MSKDSNKKIEKRRDDALRRALSTPPKPGDELKKKQRTFKIAPTANVIEDLLSDGLHSAKDAVSKPKKGKGKSKASSGG